MDNILWSLLPKQTHTKNTEALYIRIMTYDIRLLYKRQHKQTKWKFTPNLVSMEIDDEVLLKSHSQWPWFLWGPHAMHALRFY